MMRPQPPAWRRVSSITRRRCLGLLAAAAGLPVARALAQSATPAASPGASGPVVLMGVKPKRLGAPAGEQRLRLTGPLQEPLTIDPARLNDTSSAFLARQVFSGLTRFDAKLNPIPDLAERIEIAADGLTYRFTLWADARFADGSPITSEAVIAAFTRALNPGDGTPPSDLTGGVFLSDIAGAADLMAGKTKTLAGATAIDERTVEIRLVKPRATFLIKLAAPQAGIVDPRDPARGADWWRSPNASGPFKIESWTPNEKVVFAANDGYILGRPILDHIDVRIGPTAANPYNLFQAGQIDVTDVPTDAIDLALDPENPNAKNVIQTPLFSTEYMAFRDDVPPLDDPHIRQALLLAFPRDKIASVTFGGHAQPGESLIPPGMLGQSWPSTLPAVDVERAKAEIAASRYGAADKVPTIQIYTANRFGPEALRDVVEKQLGLKVEVIDAEWQSYITGLSRQEFPAYDLLWIADYPDPETFLGSLFGAGSPSNYSGYHNPRYDAALAEATATLDPAARAKLYREAQNILLGDGVVLPLYHDIRYTLASPAVHGLPMTPIGLLQLDGVWLEH
jgi:oligopeptide transport system substrate-binding protein